MASQTKSFEHITRGPSVSCSTRESMPTVRIMIEEESLRLIAAASITETNRISTMSAVNCRDLMNTLDDSWNKLNRLLDQLNVEDECNIDEVRTVYFRAKATLDERKQTSEGQTMVMLTPKQEKLPTFDGNPTEWVAFRDTFIAEVHEQSMPEAWKMGMLLMLLEGPARKAFWEYSLTLKKYQSMWTMIRMRYDRNPLFICAHLTCMRKLTNGEVNTRTDLSHLYDTLQACRHDLSKLYPIDRLLDFLFMYMIVEPRPDRESEQLCKEEFSNGDLPTWPEMKDFLDRRTKYSQNSSPTPISGIEANTEKNTLDLSIVKKEKLPKKLKKSPGWKRKCYNCNKQHRLEKCPDFLKKSWRQKMELVIDKRLCENCFGRKHSYKECHKMCCKCCPGQRHHSTLCPRIKDVRSHD